jgi:hypothetical protein
MVEQHSNPDYLETMIARELVIRDAISESCRVWIQTGNRKPMKDQDAVHFYYRLFFASKMLRWIRSGDLQCHSKTQNEFLTWLLIDSWPLLCVDLWKSELGD